MTLEEMLESIQIFKQYGCPGDEGSFGACHDVIYIYPFGQNRISEKDLKRLVELGWHQDNSPEDAREWSIEFYSPEDGWRNYV